MFYTNSAQIGIFLKTDVHLKVLERTGAISVVRSVTILSYKSGSLAVFFLVDVNLLISLFTWLECFTKIQSNSVSLEIKRTAWSRQAKHGIFLPKEKVQNGVCFIFVCFRLLFILHFFGKKTCFGCTSNSIKLILSSSRSSVRYWSLSTPARSYGAVSFMFFSKEKQEE